VCQRFFFPFFFFCETTVKDHMADILCVCVCVELPQREKEKEQKRKWTVSFWGGLLSLFILGGVVVVSGNDYPREMMRSQKKKKEKDLGGCVITCQPSAKGLDIFHGPGG
jgi:hypothetical protein